MNVLYLINDVVNSSDCIVLNDKLFMNNEWERVWKESGCSQI
jgi:hypothetical protein